MISKKNGRHSKNARPRRVYGFLLPDVIKLLTLASTTSSCTICQLGEISVVQLYFYLFLLHSIPNRPMLHLETLMWKTFILSYQKVLWNPCQLKKVKFTLFAENIQPYDIKCFSYQCVILYFLSLIYFKTGKLGVTLVINKHLCTSLLILILPGLLSESFSEMHWSFILWCISNRKTWHNRTYRR